MNKHNLEVGDEVRIRGFEDSQYSGRITEITFNEVEVLWYIHGSSTNETVLREYDLSSIGIDPDRDYFYCVNKIPTKEERIIKKIRSLDEKYCNRMKKKGAWHYA